MKKLDDWHRRFHEFLVQNKGRPFVWGEWDCCKFTDAAVQAITGERLIPRHLDWHDEPSALQVIENYGKTLTRGVAKAAKAAGLQTVHPADVQKGDVVIVKEMGGRVAGICDGYAILCPSDDGYTYRSKDQAHRVFRING